METAPEARKRGSDADPIRALRRVRMAVVLVRRRLAQTMLAPIYALYTARLRHTLVSALLPRHVAVILDGNRRWAHDAGLTEPAAGHRGGADKIDELVAWCSTLGIGEVTIWALSSDNLGRASAELDALFDVVAQKLAHLTSRAQATSPPTRIRVYGRSDQLPTHLRAAIDHAERATAGHTGLRLNIALGYSGRHELVDACKALVATLAAEGIAPQRMSERITPETIAAHLYTAGDPDPDLIIRTSGELRLSGFLPWQSAHSELYFTDAYWPAFRELDLLRALRAYQQRIRRYGH